MYMIIINKNKLNQLFFTLKGEKWTELFGKNGELKGIDYYFLIEFTADDVDDLHVFIPIRKTDIISTYRYFKIDITEGIDDQLNGQIILTGTNRHWHYNVFYIETTFPIDVITEIPNDANLLESGKVWVEGIDTENIDDIYK